NEVVGGVARQARARIARERKAATGAALVEQHGLVEVRIEESSLADRATRARAAVQEQRGLARLIAATFPVDAVSVPHIEQSVLVWLDGRELGHRFSRVGWKEFGKTS